MHTDTNVRTQVQMYAHRYKCTCIVAYVRTYVRSVVLTIEL